LRPLANPTITNLKISSHSLKENQTQKEIIEAQAWKVNDRGQIELFSPINTYNLPENPISCS
jgi:hypothetical protein